MVDVVMFVFVFNYFFPTMLFSLVLARAVGLCPQKLHLSAVVINTTGILHLVLVYYNSTPKLPWVLL